MDEGVEIVGGRSGESSLGVINLHLRNGKGDSLMAQIVKNLPAMKETQVQSLGWEHPPGNGKPLQYPCLQNSMDGGAGQATVHGITELQTTVQHNTTPTTK